MKPDSEIIVFRSKRNKVFLRGNVVEKHFVSAEAASLEAAMLEQLYAKGVRVPYPVTRENGILKMPYIPGETLPDLFARFESSPDRRGQSVLRKAAEDIVSWFRDFYRAVDADNTGEIRGDINGRNFLWDGEHCWGVDFEERVTGVKEQDIGRFIAYSLTYNPPGTPIKKMFAEMFLQEITRTFSINPTAVSAYCSQEFSAIYARRNQK